ncbi:MAG: hypothetical protein KAQ67_03480 [Gammaproteobacteria bacterium]|nr:hypothetical protein [Gammaproteobacteria bacterium]
MSKTNNKTNIFLGCIISPLAAPLTLLLIMLIAGDDLRGPSYEYNFNDLHEIFGIAGIFLTLGAPIAYIVMLGIGLPFYFLTAKLKLINFWSVTFGSAFVAIFPILLMSLPNGFVLYDDPEKNSLLFYLAFALCGYVSSLVFWFVSGLYRQLQHNH